MLRAYRPRPGYENVQGHIAYGGGGTLDIAQALADGDGRILTEDNVLQASLQEFYGDDGRVFNTFDVDSDGNETEVTLEEEVSSPGLITRRDPASSPGAETTGAEHESAEGYHALTVKELRDIAEERGLDVPSEARKQNIVEVLERSDSSSVAQGGAE